MTSQERVLLALQHKEADRVAWSDFPWATTEARWHREGMPEGVSAAEHFGFEFWGFGGDSSLQMEARVLEDCDEYTIATGADGATMKNWKLTTTTPELVDFAITSREKWDEVKPRMAYNDRRVDWDGARAGLDAARAKGLFTYLS